MVGGALTYASLLLLPLFWTLAMKRVARVGARCGRADLCGTTITPLRMCTILRLLLEIYDDSSARFGLCWSTTALVWIGWHAHSWCACLSGALLVGTSHDYLPWPMLVFLLLWEMRNPTFGKHTAAKPSMKSHQPVRNHYQATSARPHDGQCRAHGCKQRGGGSYSLATW